MRGESQFYRDRRQCEHPDCPFCAMMYFEWLKERVKQMSVPRKRKVMPSGFVKPAEAVSFETAAGTSNIPRDPDVAKAQREINRAGWDTLFSATPEELGEAAVALVESSKRNACNRHLDCDEADVDTRLGHPERVWGADHCYDSCCEDCFGY